MGSGTQDLWALASFGPMSTSHGPHVYQLQPQGMLTAKLNGCIQLFSNQLVSTCTGLVDEFMRRLQEVGARAATLGNAKDPLTNAQELYNGTMHAKMADLYGENKTLQDCRGTHGLASGKMW